MYLQPTQPPSTVEKERLVPHILAMVMNRNSWSVTYFVPSYFHISVFPYDNGFIIEKHEML
jgi:hypothetical protein